jgi:hypothetical protein
MPKKYWQLTLLALYACGFSYGENNLGAARTVISREANVPLTALAGGGALNYLLLVSVLLTMCSRPVYTDQDDHRDLPTSSGFRWR